jgi:peptidylprolyl isomerase
MRIHERVCVAGAVLLAAFSAAAPAADETVVARMGAVAITLGEARVLADPDRSAAGLSPQGVERLVRTEVIRRALADEARRKGVDRTPEVAARMSHAAEEALVAAYMNQIARPPADYPAEAEIRQAYETSKEALTLPRRVRLSQIYLSGTDAKTTERADALYRQATRPGADFAAIARAESQQPDSAARDGDMGWLAEDQLMPEFRTALAGLKAGQVAKPVAGAGGMHVLRLVERKEAETIPLEQARERLVRSLRLKRAAEIERDYIDAMLKRTPIAVNGIALQELAGGPK